MNRFGGKTTVDGKGKGRFLLENEKKPFPSFPSFPILLCCTFRVNIGHSRDGRKQCEREQTQDPSNKKSLCVGAEDKGGANYN